MTFRARVRAEGAAGTPRFMSRGAEGAARDSSLHVAWGGRCEPGLLASCRAGEGLHLARAWALQMSARESRLAPSMVAILPARESRVAPSMVAILPARTVSHPPSNGGIPPGGSGRSQRCLPSGHLTAKGGHGARLGAEFGARWPLIPHGPFCATWSERLRAVSDRSRDMEREASRRVRPLPRHGPRRPVAAARFTTRPANV